MVWCGEGRGRGGEGRGEEGRGLLWGGEGVALPAVMTMCEVLELC